MKRILVIEDNHDLRETIADLLREENFEVFSTGKGSLALELHAQNPFDLVITDIIMPDTEGIEIILTLKRNYPGVNIIAITGGGYLSSEIILEMTEQLGVNGSLKKPFDPDALLKIVYNTLKLQEEC
ncbi:MAG: response regulator [Bacteroidales bacterium]